MSSNSSNVKMLLIALFFCATALGAQTPLLAPEPQLPDGSTEYKAGDEFYLDIRVGASNTTSTEQDIYSAVQNLFGVSFILVYDTTKVSVLKTEKGDFLGRDVLFFPMNDPAEVAIGLSAKKGSGATGSGLLARLRIKIKDNLRPGAQVVFRIEQIVANDPQGTPILLTAGKSAIVIDESSVLPGDVNADSRVNIFDLIALLRELHGLETYPNSDVNNDGKVDINDLLALLRILNNQWRHHG